MKLLDLLNESDFNVKTVGGNLVINDITYKLKVKKGLWLSVNVLNVTPIKDTYEITASALGFEEKNIVPKESLDIIKRDLGQKEIYLGGEDPKKLVKIK